jgi:hypothetical protein
MKRLISMIFILGAAVTVLSQTAVAHERSYEHRDSPRQYRIAVHRDHHMPRWLRKKKDFRRWYKRSALRHNHALAWWQLYDIFRWEGRYHRHNQHRPAYYTSRDYGWYRDYWHKRDYRYRYDRDTRRGDYRHDRFRDRHRHRD